MDQKDFKAPAFQAYPCAAPAPRELTSEVTLSSGLVDTLYVRRTSLRRDLSSATVRQRYYNKLNEFGLLRQPTSLCGPPVSAARCGPAVSTGPRSRGAGRGLQPVVAGSFQACSDAVSGLRTMFRASEIQAMGARHQFVFNAANIWFGFSVQWHVGTQGVTLVAIGEGWGGVPAGEVRIGLWDNKPCFGAEHGAMLGVGGTFGYIYRTHDWYRTQEGIRHEVSDGLFLRVGSPHVGVIIMVDRDLENFVFCFDYRLFFPLPHGVLFRAGIRPMVRAKVVDRDAFRQGVSQFTRARLGQQAVLERLSAWANQQDA